MKTFEFQAKTSEEAVSAGLEQLGLSLADVKIEVVDNGKIGLFGLLGSKPAVVRLTVEDDAAVSETAAASEVTAEEPAKEEPAAEAQEAPASEKKPAPVKQPAPAKPAPAAVETAPSFPEDSLEAKAYEFLKELTTLMGVNVTINLHRDEEGNIRADMFGDTLGILIGRRGETLDALQYLTSLYINRGQDEYTRITLDTENYRAKREEALRRLANRMANRAVKTGRKVVMEPMNPYERRILHSALQQNEAVTTHSEGEEPNRHVVITLKQDS